MRHSASTICAGFCRNRLPFFVRTKSTFRVDDDRGIKTAHLGGDGRVAQRGDETGTATLRDRRFT
ncbi:hypothetical protein Ga0080559_TMP3977 [Salipiger profundus]|uniref:Uncharacterized protein n=1 Tax=Salipiger profundus TaxID=1229727 RepID=A0A1U7D9G6_9RHOB|nr:hypothetical protein Ga0080559_TMP3977 [Salipiger profundus]